MVGITSYGAYVPMLRMPLAAIGGGAVKPGGPEKAVANWDEDAVTMAVAAAIVARALDLRRDVMTADVGDSLRAGTTALLTAVDAVKAGSAKRVLVVVGETRLA